MVSCVATYHIKDDQNGEPTMNKNLYSFNKLMFVEDSEIVDTTAIYVEYNPNESLNSEKTNLEVLIFHNNGFFESTSNKYFRKFKEVRGKHSAYYGGKFTLSGKTISIEKFYPAKEGKAGYYIKEISVGKVNEDTISIKIFNNNYKYVKKKLESLKYKPDW